MNSDFQSRSKQHPMKTLTTLVLMGPVFFYSQNMQVWMNNSNNNNQAKRQNTTTVIISNSNLSLNNNDNNPMLSNLSYKTSNVVVTAIPKPIKRSAVSTNKATQPKKLVQQKKNSSNKNPVAQQSLPQQVKIPQQNLPVQPANPVIPVTVNQQEQIGYGELNVPVNRGNQSNALVPIVFDNNNGNDFKSNASKSNETIVQQKTSENSSQGISLPSFKFGKGGDKVSTASSSHFKKHGMKKWFAKVGRKISAGKSHGKGKRILDSCCHWS
jgi:hypothetical protein